MFFGVGEKLEREKEEATEKRLKLSSLFSPKLKNSKKTRNFPTHNSGDRTHHLLLELHSTGNICLTDADYRVLTLLRSHRFANAEAAAGTPEAAPAMASSSSRSKGAAAASSTAVAVAIAANRPYPIGAVVRPRSRLTAEALRAALIVEKNAAGAATGDDDGTATAAKKKARKKKKAPSNSLKALLSRAMPHGSAIAEHVAVAAGLDPERDVLDSQGRGRRRRRRRGRRMPSSLVPLRRRGRGPAARGRRGRGLDRPLRDRCR